MSGIFTALSMAAGSGGATIVRPEPWWHAVLQQSVLLVILFIFLTAIVTLVIQQRRKDKCLKLMHGYHVSMLRVDGPAAWGGLLVFSQGMELVYDAPYRTRRGIVKASTLIYQNEMDQCLALTRSAGSLPEAERRRRLKQVRRSFKPNIFRRVMRWGRNLLNTLRDAFSKAFSVILGQIAKSGASTVLAQQQAGVDQIGQTLIGAAGNAYEPILEHHIGRPVVVQLTAPEDPQKRLIDVPGYLVDYTDKYLAVFNVEHEPISDQTLEVTEPTEGEGYRIDLTEELIRITCTGPDLVMVKSLSTDQRHSELSVALPLGCQVELNRDGAGVLRVRLQRTRHVDLVCPRALARVHFGGGEELAASPPPSHGVAPEPAVEQHSDRPAPLPPPQPPLPPPAV